jgi:2-polyprenyl-3-methyl-5-hydroxy-6-metoxy-1,4-benzoquinol methylase
MTHNTRAPQICEIVTQAVDFTGKKVLDLGCGYGDLMICAARAGASAVSGIDHMPTVTSIARSNIAEAGLGHICLVYNPMDIDKLAAFTIPMFQDIDIVFCFSVLPYLRNIPGVAGWMRKMFKMAFFEIQSEGDGPGLEFLGNDDIVFRFLNYYWDNVAIIGQTLVKDRNKYRTIWMCT